MHSTIRRMHPRLCAALLATAVLAAPNVAAAFCGFYVAGADSKLYNHATVVVMMREGNRTVLSMRNNYDGPPEKFAMVVPVPVVLKQDDVKTLPAAVFDRIDRLSAPRLVEYWEQDPCAQYPVTLDKPTSAGPGGGGGGGYGGGGGGGTQVKVEAEFAVGEYDIVILSAEDALALATWLTSNGYVLPAGASEHLQPYVASGSKFFVAKVDPSRVTFDAKGMAMLSPLRVHYPSDDFRLPIRLGLINADGPQDLLVHILSTKGRFEAANYPNVPLPTEIEVKEPVRAGFPAFYAALFDGLLARHPGAVVTEYAWDARTCDPCPDQPLSSTELASLGMDVLFDGTDILGMPMVRQAAVTTEGPHTKDIVRRIIRAHINEIRACYNQVLAKHSSWSGSVRIDFTIAKTGKVSAASHADGGEHGVDACIVDRVKKWTFPKDTAPTTVMAPFWLNRDLTGGRSFVLTRLHARYDAKSLGEDLVFRTALPIANGSHGSDGPFVQAAQAWQDNRFQGRFILRHPWPGAIDCVNPQRGHYTDEPPTGKKQVHAVTDAAFAPRGGADLASLTVSPILALAEPIRPLPAPKPWTPSTPPEQPPEAPPTAAGCGCRTDAPAGPGLLLVVAPLLRRRRLASAAANR